MSVRPGGARTWARCGETSAAGFAAHAGDMLDAAGVARAVDTCPPEGLPRLLDDLNGHFAAIKRTDDAVLAIVDHVRSIPLLAARRGDGSHVVTDDVEIAAREAGTDPEPDPGRLAELLATLYVTGPDTLLRNVAQVEAGSYRVLPTHGGGHASVHRWYAFRPNVHAPPAGDLVEEGGSALFNALGRTIAAAGDAQLVVPLSGGLDSRLLLHLLLQHDVDRERILTFTYGRPGNRDAAIAEEIARRLGLRWVFTPYSPDTWRKLRDSAEWAAHMRTGSSLSATPNLHDAPAMLALREHGALQETAMLLPGHSGGFPCGSWIPSLARRRSGTRRQLVDALLVNHYRLRSFEALARLTGRSTGEITTVLRERAEHSLPESPEHLGREELVGVTEEWVWKERQAKFIVNAVRAYEHLGLRWALPWWDREVVDFWERVPLRERLGLPLRDRIAASAGDDVATGTWKDRLEKRAIRSVRTLGVEPSAKRARTLVRRARPAHAYRNDPLGWHAIIDEDRFRAWYSGREVGWAFLGEAVIDAFFDGALKA